MPDTTALHAQLTAHLASKDLPPDPAWLSSFLSNTNLSVPAAALQKTALFRLLASDFTTSLAIPQSSPSSVFPRDILDGNVAEHTLQGPIPVQVLDVEDVSRSRWSAVEALEAAERGETTKGREVIRVVPGEEGTNDGDGDASGAVRGMCKMLLQDARGTRVYGFELSPVEGVSVGMGIGAKVMLRGVVVARGVLLLEGGSATVLGGKIDGLHAQWKQQRKDRLKEALGVGGEV